MKKLIVEKYFWDIFPDAKIGVVICKDFDNSNINNSFFKNLIEEALKESKKYLICEDFKDNEIIKNWRNTYKKFKTKKGARSSIESLLKRSFNNNAIPSINPLVDIYNSVSLKFGIPCGAEDIEKIAGDMKLTKAKGDEEFIALGTNETTLPYENELIYKDDQGTICRSLNWREATRTMITNKTKKAILCLELIESERNNDLVEALNFLSITIKNTLGGDCQFKILDFVHNSLIID